MALYKVAVSKLYFPRESWGEMGIGQFDEHAYMVRVRASSREEAAAKAWERHGREWRARMEKRASRLVVRLHVNAPEAGQGGLAGRLVPVKVYEE